MSSGKYRTQKTAVMGHPEEAIPSNHLGPKKAKNEAS